MTTPCIGCRAPVPIGTGGRCGRCRSVARRGRSSRPWRNLAAAVTAAGVCAGCGAVGVPLQAAHVDGLALGGALLGPARALCGPCHQTETADELQQLALRRRR